MEAAGEGAEGRIPFQVSSPPGRIPSSSSSSAPATSSRDAAAQGFSSLLMLLPKGLRSKATDLI